MLVQPAGDPGSLARQLTELNHIGAALSAERDTGRLLDLILTKAREITKSDAGSLYIVEETPTAGGEPHTQLRFKIAQNDSITIPFHESTLGITRGSIAGCVALTGDPIVLEDAYDIAEQAPYRFDRSFDEADGYRTRSVLAVPMRTPKGGTLGVIQLINAMWD
ncbi:MAG TPA: GAF domain-containing protein, partial [Vicinamibacterales bacterium]|nr:GAF domain-containing protein [Vicinamibacterales bacterium]